MTFSTSREKSGVETGSQGTLQRYKRGHAPSRSERLFRWLGFRLHTTKNTHNF